MAIVGIDLGTTFSAIAVLDDIGNPEVVASIDNDRITPSVVYISAENKIYVGDKHPHEIQKPKLIDFGKLNKLNKVR